MTIGSTGLVNFYLNGTLTGTANQQAGTINLITTTNAMRIGNRATATDGTFDGGIREVKMWNRVLTSAEITADYMGTTNTNGLIHFFRLYGDYADYGSVGNTATNSGSVPAMIEDRVAAAVKSQRVTANDKFIMDEINGMIFHAAIEEAA
jgi:hypothetical protein